MGLVDPPVDGDVGELVGGDGQEDVWGLDGGGAVHMRLSTLVDWPVVGGDVEGLVGPLLYGTVGGLVGSDARVPVRGLVGGDVGAGRGVHYRTWPIER